MSEPLIGTIIMFAGNYAPQGWALCDGSLLPINQNAALFAVIGATYGGDGFQTFALPDLRGRVPIQPGQGSGLSPYQLGERGGSENATLLVGNLPQHVHLVNCNSAGGNQAAPGGGLPAVESTGTSLDFTNNPPDSTMNPQMIAPAGGNQPFPVVQPFACVNFIIALVGSYPTRS